MTTVEEPNLVVPPLPPAAGISVKLRIHYNTNWGDVVCVCGSPGALGAWDGQHAMAMVYTPGSVWEVSFTIPTAVAGVFEYKYLIRHEGNITWESGPNRSLLFVPTAYDSTVIEDSWHTGGEFLSLFSFFFTRTNKPFSLQTDLSTRAPSRR